MISSENAADWAAEVLTQRGVSIRRLAPGQGQGENRPGDLELDLGRETIALEMKYRALADESAARNLLSERRTANIPLLVVADRVTEEARHLLVTGGGYLDLRGRLALHAPGVFIDADLEPVMTRAGRTGALSGSAGLEVAVAILMAPNRSVTVRGLARELRRSPSTVSEILSALRSDGFLSESNVLSGPDLFFAVASRWPTRRFQLAAVPVPGASRMMASLHLGLDDLDGPGWALTDSAAAVAYGAPLAYRSGQVLDFLVPNEAIARRALTVLGEATLASGAEAAIRVAPVPMAAEQRVDLSSNPTEWPLAHPLFVALDLAQDAGRGREILDAWTPDARWSRVW